jgi:hypothetical protein
MLLVSMIFLPAMNETDSNLVVKESNSSDIYCAEKYIISNLYSNQSSSENLTKAEGIREIKLKHGMDRKSDSLNKYANKLLQQEQMLNRSLSIHEVQKLLGKET